jgi:acetylornithine deacetylase/succinyl-diaminopimelate desuccinylase-like protein
MSCKMTNGAKAWLSDPKHPNYEAAARAIEKVYGVPPDYSREGGSIPITPALEEATQMNVLLLPIGASDDMAHSQNEKYNIENLVKGIKVNDLLTLMLQNLKSLWMLTIYSFIAYSFRYWGFICMSLVILRVPSLHHVAALH